LECGSDKVIQRASYTPDLLVEARSGFWLEVKGYFQQSKRAALRDLIKTRKGFDLRMVLSSDHKAGKGKLSEYMVRNFPTIPFVFRRVRGFDAPGDYIPREWLEEIC
jgi:hypothetical protein